MTGQSSYFVRAAQIPAEREVVTAVWRGNLGEAARAESKFDWFYAGSVTGTPQTLLLMHRRQSGDAAEIDETVGVGSAAPRSFWMGRQRIEAGVLVDLAVLPAHRTLFPALLLQKSLLASGLRSNHILYAFPNQKAAAVFQRAGYRRIGLMTRFVRVLRSRSYLEERLPAPVALLASMVTDLALSLRYAHLGRKPKLRWESITAAVPLSDEHETETSGLLRGARSEQLLRWRFADNGRQHCSFVTARHRADDTVLGYWVVEEMQDGFYVRDCSVSLLIRPDAIPAWSSLCAEARRKGFRSLHFECLAPQKFREHLRSLGINPRSQRPVFGAVRADLAARAESCEWFLTAADEDE